MKTLALAFWMIGTVAAAASDDPPTPSTSGATPKVVDVARESKAKRKNSTTRVITNADVKKSKAKLGTTSAPEAPVQPEPTLMEKHQAARAAEAAAAERKTKSETLIAELEKELAAIEQSYYSEGDLNKRDTVIARRFADVKKRLDEARAAGFSPPNDQQPPRPASPKDDGGLKPAAPPEP